MRQDIKSEPLTSEAPAAKPRARRPAAKKSQETDKAGPALEGQQPPIRHVPRPDAFDALLEPDYYGKKLTDPIDTAKDKWTLLPAFLKVKGLIKQHLDSFNYFIETELRNIVAANRRVRSDVDEKAWIEYAAVYETSKTSF